MSSLVKTCYVYRMVLFLSLFAVAACGDDDDTDNPDDGSGGSDTDLFSIVIGGSGDDVLVAIDTTDDGGYVAAGYSESGGGNTELIGEGAWVVKLSALGEIEWSRGYIPANSESGFFADIRQSTDGNYLLCGTASTEDQDRGWIVKLDARGDILWELVLLPGAGDGDGQFYGITETSGELVVAVGYLTLPGTDLGEQAWLQTVSLVGGSLLGGEIVGGFGDDSFQAVVSDAFNQTVLAVGYTGSPSLDINDYQGGDDVLLAQIFPTGGLVSVQAIGGSGDEAAFDVALAADGSFVVGAITDSQDGAVGSVAGDDALWLFNVEEGLLEEIFWSETEPVTIDREEGLNDLELTSTGDIQVACSECLTATSTQDATLYRFDGTGQFISLSAFGGSGDDIAYQSRSIDASRMVVLAATESTDGDVQATTFGGADAWIFVVEQ